MNVIYFFDPSVNRHLMWALNANQASGDEQSHSFRSNSPYQKSPLDPPAAKSIAMQSISLLQYLNSTMQISPRDLKSHSPPPPFARPTISPSLNLPIPGIPSHFPLITPIQQPSSPERFQDSSKIPVRKIPHLTYNTQPSIALVRSKHHVGSYLSII